jgi:hypothetical protein
LYNSELIKDYYQPSKKVITKQESKNNQKEDPTPKSSPLPLGNIKFVNKTYEGRQDGGTTTRSKADKFISPNITYVKVVQGKTIKKVGEEIFKFHTLINFIKSQKQKSPQIEINMTTKSRCKKKIHSKIELQRIK